MTVRTLLPTQFALAERADPTAIAGDVEHFERQALIQELFATVPDIFLILNEERQIVFANRALLQLLQVDCIEAVAGQRPGEAIGCHHATESEGGCGTTEFCRTCGAVRAILSSLRGVEDSQECRIIRADGSALDLRVHTRPMDLNGRRYALFSVTDISHEKRRRVLERIFFHDILNTAGGMVGVGDILRNGSVEEFHEFKDMIFTLASSLVDEIKAQQILSAAESGELVLETSQLDSLAILEEICAIYRHHEVGQERHLAISADARRVSFCSDRTLVRRVVGNMVKNALEASAAGQVVTLDCQPVPDGVEFSVHNPNLIPRNVQLQIFQRSFSTKGAGRGLGTYSMRLLCEQYLRGAVRFVSSASEGTTFYAVMHNL